jgi:hypothetical protein
MGVGLRRWLKARLGLSAEATAQELERINLVEEAPLPLELPAQAGIDLTLVQKPWSVSRLATIFRDAQRTPTVGTLQAARQARHCLSFFWLVAPVDQLEALYGGDIGDLQRRQLEGPLSRHPLAHDERQWRDQLAARLADGALASQQHNLLLALMPYFSPYSLTVPEPLETLPRWLLKDYVVYCEPELKAQLDGPAGLLQPSSTSGSAEELELLSELRGEEAMAWFRDEEALSRMQALINLYGMDPEDRDTLEELAELRRVAAQLWLDVHPSQLQTLYGTPVGLLTRSLVTAGFGRELLSEDDVRARQQLAPRVADLSRPDAVNALLAVLMFYPPNKVEFEDASELPVWLQEELRSF